MEYDKDKVDEIVLALLYLTSFQDEYATRAWKSMDWGAMYRLHEKDTLAIQRERPSRLLYLKTGKDFQASYSSIISE